MSIVIKYYGKVGLVLYLCSLFYFWINDYVNLGPKNLGVFLSSLIFLLTVVPLSLLVLARPKNKLAKWAKVPHAEILKLTDREEVILEWGYKKDTEISGTKIGQK